MRQQGQDGANHGLCLQVQLLLDLQQVLLQLARLSVGPVAHHQLDKQTNH